jgi:hypothetical protein
MINIYQDLDGVLSPFSDGAPRTNTLWKGEWRTERIAGFSMLWSVELIDALREIDSREDVNFIWLTSWEDMAVEFFAPVVGIGSDWPVLASNDAQDDLKTWWKLRALRDHALLTEPEKMIWLDDDINYDVGGKDYVKTMGDMLLAINPNRNHGLTLKHIARMIEFINE